MIILWNVKSRPHRRIYIYLIITISIVLFGLALSWLIKADNLSDNYVRQGVTVNGISFSNLSEEAARNKLQELTKAFIKWPQDAGFEHGVIKEERAGRFIAINQTLEVIHQAPQNTNVSPIYYDVLSLYKIDELNQIKYGKGTDKEFHYLTNGEIKELKNLSEKLFNHLLYPGETFSLADFLQSNCNFDQQFNSDLPQLLARTLYNTVKKANFEIVEAWLIPQPKLGAVSNENIDFQPGKDLKFRNNSTSPLIIRGEVTEERLKIWLLGK